MQSSWSIRRRLFSLWLLMLLVVGGAVYIVTGEIAKRTLERGQDSDLQAVAMVILDSVVNTPDGPLFDLPYSAFEVLAYSAPERMFYAVRADQIHLAGYDDLPRFGASGVGPEFFSTIYRGEQTRFVVAHKPIRPGSESRVSVVIGQTQASYLAFAANVANWLAIAVLLAFCMLAVWAELSLRHSLKPFVSIERNLAGRSPDDFSPLTEDTPREIARLVETLNDTLEQHRVLLERNRAFIAEATHQIKTPIAAIVTASEVLERKLPSEHRHDARQVVVRARYASKLVAQLLTRASLTYREMLKVREDVNLVQLAESVARTMDPTAEVREVGLTVEVPDAPVVVQGDRVAIREALVCLVDNAIAHTPELSEVIISVGVENGCGWLEVLDNGTGFPSDADSESTAIISRDSSGSHQGLGLAIVKRVSDSHGAVLVLGNLPSGGARCRISFA